jgi:transglutaminase-like putative cysteine protease
MRMGSVAELAIDDRIAIWLRFDGAAPAPETLYFRGPVLSRFDGVEWRPLPGSVRARQAPPNTDLRVAGPALGYEMTLEPLRLPLLPLLEATATAPQIEGYTARAVDDLQWAVERPVHERLRFRAEAHTRFRHGPARSDAALREQNLQLPANFNPRTIAWAEALRRDPQYLMADARTLADAVLQHIRRGGYSYTLTPGDYGHDAIDEFWLDRKAGFCEHFAAAFVVVMRAMDVPARVVTGFQGADLLPVDGYMVVRQNAAHAWAEYWQPGQGWVRADPTAAVAPERIVRSRRLAPAPGLVAGALGAVSPELLTQLRSGWEALNNRWNQWVLNYSRGHQLNLMRNLGFTQPAWEDLALLLVTTLSALALGGAAWAWWDRHRIDPWVRQMERIRAALRRLGIPAFAHDPPRSLALRVRATLGPRGDALAQLLDALDAQRYSRAASPRPDATLTRRFVSQARALRSMAADNLR